jgi:uncharacterized protein
MGPQAEGLKPGPALESRYRDLRDNLARTGPCIVAFSGGVDSTFLLRVAHEVLRGRVEAVTAVSPSLARSERTEAEALARLIGAPHRLVETHEADDPGYRANDGRRCYFCKKELFRVLASIALEAGGLPVLYGAIPDDLAEDRPGMLAAREAGARAPLVEAGLTKPMIRDLSKRLGLPTWDKPATACLASRIATHTPVSIGALGLIERAERAVRALGYVQVRARLEADGSARIEIDRRVLDRGLSSGSRALLLEAVLEAGFPAASIDPRGYRPAGSRPADGRKEAESR